MSDLSRLDEAISWARDWREHYGDNDEGFRAHVARVADEQRANYESCTSGRRAPTWCNPAEYRRAVEALEKIAQGEAL